MAITKNLTQTPIQAFADWVGYDPLAFNGLDLTPCNSSYTHECADAWFQYSAQGSKLSREKLAETLAQAEYMIADVLGSFVSPTWVQGESHRIAEYFDLEQPRQINIESMTFQTRFKNVAKFGQRKKTLIETASLSYVDSDSDGFNEVATLASTLPIGTEICNVKLFFANNNGGDEYEVRPVTVTSYNQETGDATWEIDPWLLVDPEQYYSRRFGRQQELNACEASIYVSELEVWVEDVDACLPNITIYSRPLGCEENCEYTITPACAIMVDPCAGYFKLKVQSYDTEGCVTTASTHLQSGHIVEYIKVNYLAGCVSCGLDYSKCKQLLSPLFKLTASMLPIVFCECDCLKAIITKWQEETSLIVKDTNTQWRFPNKTRTNSPWGTTLGALEAYLEVLQYEENMC